MVCACVIIVICEGSLEFKSPTDQTIHTVARKRFATALTSMKTIVLFLCYKLQIWALLTSGITDEGRQGANSPPPWQLRCWPLLRNGPLNSLPLLSKQVLKFETFSLYKFVFFCYCSSVLQRFAQRLY